MKNNYLHIFACMAIQSFVSSVTCLICSKTMAEKYTEGLEFASLYLGVVFFSFVALMVVFSLAENEK